MGFSEILVIKEMFFPNNFEERQHFISFLKMNNIIFC